MNALRTIGVFASWIFGGALVGLITSVIVGVVWAFLIVAEGNRSPGNDPLVPLVLMWVFVMAPGSMLVGMVVGSVLSVVHALYKRFRDGRDR